MTRDAFIRDLLGGRLGDQGKERRSPPATTFNRERRARLLGAASQAVVATRIVLDVLDEALHELAADVAQAEQSHEEDSSESERRESTAPSPQGEVKLTYDIRSKTPPTREEDQEPIRLKDESEAEGS